MSTTTNTSVELDHPYWGAGLIAILASFGVLAFALGVLDRCGGGSGICFSPATHASGDAGLVAFVILFIVGVALIATTGTGAITTQSTRRDPPTPAVTNVFPAPVASAPAPTVTNVYPTTTVEPATQVVTTP